MSDIAVTITTQNFVAVVQTQNIEAVVQSTLNIPVVLSTQSLPVVVDTTNTPVVISTASIPVVVGIQGPTGATGPSGASVLSKTAGETLGGNRVVMVDTDGKVYYADRSIVSHANKVLGLTQGAASVSTAVNVQTYGVMTEPSWNWDMTKPVFLSTTGLLTQTAPAAGFILMLGFPISTTSMLIDIDKPIVIQ